MILSTPSGFGTDRLVVDEWHSLMPTDEDLAKSVVAILTPSVSEALPSGWQGEYSIERATQWIKERDQESTTMLILDRLSHKPVGLMILSEGDDEKMGRSVRIGYMLAEDVWGHGLATELLHGFVCWCRTATISSIVAGVARNNIASQRVMEKAGFEVQPTEPGDRELFYRLDNV